MKLKEEKWVPIKGYESFYEVSDHGNVRSLPRVIVRSNGRPQRVKGRFLAPTPSTYLGYLKVGLMNNGKQEAMFIYHLVAHAFLGDRPEKMDVCHCGGNVKNNYVSTLRYDSRQGNLLDKQLHGTDHNRKKTHCPYGHPLMLPNLTQCGVRKGHRKCLACSRARAYRQSRFLGEKQHQEISDWYLQRLWTGLADIATGDPTFTFRISRRPHEMAHAQAKSPEPARHQALAQKAQPAHTQQDQEIKK